MRAINKGFLFAVFTLMLFALTTNVNAGADDISITLDTPAESALVTGTTYNVSATVVNNDTITNVTFWVLPSGGSWTMIGSDTNDTENDTDYSFEFDSTTQNDGNVNFTFNATAYPDNNGLVIYAEDTSNTVSIDNGVPTTSITLVPALNVNEGEQLTSTCTADDEVDSSFTINQVVEDPFGVNTTSTGGTFSVPASALILESATSGYTVHCYVVDDAGISGGSTQTFSYASDDKTVAQKEAIEKKDSKGFFARFWWLGLILVMAVVVVVIILSIESGKEAKRRKKR